MSVPSWAEPYIEQMNGDVARGFFWKDANGLKWNGDSQGRVVDFDPKSISYWLGAGSASDYVTGTLGGCTILDVYVTGNDNDGYRYNATGARKNIEFATGIWASAWRIWKNSDSTYSIEALSSGNPQDTMNLYDNDPTLLGIIQKASVKFKNINLFVNGEDWTSETTYNWQSVPSISGNDKVVMLSTLNDINNGEIVETTDITKINLNNNSNVHNIVRDIINNW